MKSLEHIQSYAEQCSNDTSVHNIFPILGIHTTSKKKMFRNQTDYVTPKYAITKEDKIKSAETIQTYNKIY